MARALKDVNAGAVMNGNVISNLQFADDIAALAESQDELQGLVNNIVTESKKMGMAVNIEKTEVQHIGSMRKEVKINICDSELKQV